jgi:predicted nucleic acid-binding protein
MPAYLLDTNILLRAADPKAVTHSAAVQSVASLLSRGEQCYITPQILVEFWAVVTRPVAANGFGWTVAHARDEVERLLQQFPLLEETPAVFTEWLALVVSHRVTGKQAHDARLLATMRAHGVTHVLTFNVGDFPSGAGITVMHPQDLA